MIYKFKPGDLVVYCNKTEHQEPGDKHFFGMIGIIEDYDDNPWVTFQKDGAKVRIVLHQDELELSEIAHTPLWKAMKEN